MFESIKESFSHCEDCGRSLFFVVNIFKHPIKRGKLLCEDCNVKYEDYRMKSYFEALDESMTKMIDRLYDCALRDLE